MSVGLSVCLCVCLSVCVSLSVCCLSCAHMKLFNIYTILPNILSMVPEDETDGNIIPQTTTFLDDGSYWQASIFKVGDDVRQVTPKQQYTVSTAVIPLILQYRTC